MIYPKFLPLVLLLILSVDLANAQDESPWASTEKTKFVPEIHHPNIEAISLFAQNPEIVTPVGIAVAPDGRVFVQENHTHKRNSNYQGPKTDRILIFEDTNGDGKADKRSIFYEGDTFSTDLLFGPDGHLYVSTRWFIGRFLNASTKQKADGEPNKLVVCDTDGNYPHNGVGGLAIDPANPEWISFGFGENLGVDYTFVGSDGVKLSGGAEGGSTYRCRTDGSKLTRQSTGHWNAFGMSYDLAGNLYSTDNDPNATPPNRLLHIVPGADYGYEYRYGRSGQHPLVCWFGENPGTLGMIGALGEAACGVIAHGPNHLLTASWTDNRIDLHSLKPKGKSFTATREPFISGPDDFRPVHFSYSADGKYLYFTDWVKLSYPVHGSGRIWRVKFKTPIRQEPTLRASQLQETTPEMALKLLGSNDPYVRTNAIYVLTNNPDTIDAFNWKAEQSDVARAHFAVVMKRIGTEDHQKTIPELLKDSSADVRYVAIKWIADQGLSQYQSNLESLLDRPYVQRKELRSVLAALATISGSSKGEFSPENKMLEIALDTNKLPGLRAMALQGVGVDHKQLTIKALAALAKEENLAIRREAIRSLVIHADVAKVPILAQLASDKILPAYLRADAIAGMAAQPADHIELLKTLASGENKVIANEAHRTLVSAGVIERKLKGKPEIEDIKAWQALVKHAPGKANPAVGRRLFFHPKMASCFRCHAMDGRGHQVGPDLTTIHKQTGITQDWLLKHMVNPNAEMAPYYRPQILLTYDGKVQTGLIVGREGKLQAYIAADGKIFYINKEDVEERRELTTSIMPTDLLDKLTAAEIRDLIAFLLQGSES